MRLRAEWSPIATDFRSIRLVGVQLKGLGDALPAVLLPPQIVLKMGLGSWNGWASLVTYDSS